MPSDRMVHISLGAPTCGLPQFIVFGYVGYLNEVRRRGIQSSALVSTLPGTVVAISQISNPFWVLLDGPDMRVQFLSL